MSNISFNITDAEAARDAIETLAYIATGFDPAFPAAALIATLPSASPADGSRGDTAD
jgi:hypothetical protein